MTDAPLAVLQRALAKLDGMALDTAARAAVDAAMAAVQALQKPAAAVDRSVFDALLAMAGPEVAPELLVQMAADLRAVSGALPPAIRSRDWDALRAQSHVLVALAGAAGASGLADRAQVLNRAAHMTDAPAADLLADPIAAGLQQLIGFIEQAQQDVPSDGRNAGF